MTPTELCNVALGHIGQARIADIGERSPAAEHCRRMFDHVRRMCLRDHDWNFAIDRKTLTALDAAPPFGYSVAYQLPADFLRVLSINGQPAGVRGANWEVEGRTVLCNAPYAHLRYVFDATDTEQWDDMFGGYFAYRLAAAIAPSLRIDPQAGMQLEQMAAALRASAQEADRVETAPMVTRLDQSEIIQERGGWASGTAYGTDTGNTSGSTIGWGRIAVAGQGTVAATIAGDTFTLVAGTNVTLTTDAGAKTITIAASGAGGGTVNLTPSRTATAVTITPSGGGTAAEIPQANATHAGVMSADQHNKLDDLPTGGDFGDLAFQNTIGAADIDAGAVTEVAIAAGAVTFSKIAPAAIGTGATQIAVGNDSRFHAAASLAASLTGVFAFSGQQLQAVTDIGADRIVFLDQSANALAYLVVGAGLSITGTTLTAPAGGTGSEIQIRNSVTGEAAAVAGTSVDGTTIILGAADNLGTGTAERLRLRNITPAANGAPQNSPAIAWEGSAWNTGAGASQSIEYRTYLKAAPGGSTPVGQFVIEARTNLGTWTEVSHFRFGYTASGIWSTSGFGSASTSMPFWVGNSTQALQLSTTGGWVLGPFAVRAGGVDATFTADAANVFAFRNGTNAQTVRVYDTFASATDYHRVGIATARATLSGLSGASVTAAGLIPAGAIVVGVTAKVLTAVTGATSWQLGTAADHDRFAATGAIALGSTTDNRNWTSGALECFLTATDLVLTANGSNFTGGSVYISVQYIRGEAD